MIVLKRRDGMERIVEVTINLPEDLAQEAREFDLLTEAKISALLRAEVDRRVMETVNAEIQTYRAEKTVSRETSDQVVNDPRRAKTPRFVIPDTAPFPSFDMRRKDRGT